MKKEILLGQKFNRLLVIAESKPINKRAAWLCQCDCGVNKIVKSEELKNGDTKSCGCLNKEKRIERAATRLSRRSVRPDLSARTPATVATSGA